MQKSGQEPRQEPRRCYSQKSIRSFVVRSGKFTRGQEANYRKLNSKYCLDYHDFGAHTGDPVCQSERQAYWQRRRQECQAQSLLCEIGFGTGSATWKLAQMHPEALYLGIEVYRGGIAALMQKAEEMGLENLRIVEHDALEVLENMLPPASLDGLHIFFPDPWPKKRHRKRRIVNAQSLRLFYSRLKPGAYLYFVTDWVDYAETIRELVWEQSDSWAFEADADGYSRRRNWRAQSKFETKASREGRHSFELFLRKRV